MTLTPLLGNSQKLDGGAMFGNAPKALWSRWAEPDELNRIDLACRCLLVELEGRRILLEAGIGCFFEAKLRERFGVVEQEHVLLRSLGEVGLSHQDIDLVILSHLHFDHAGGLLSGWPDNRLLFPNAEFIVGREHWERACNPHPRDRASFIPTLNEQLRDCGRLRLVTVDDEILPGWRFHKSEGHTPGLLLTEIPHPDGPVVFAADLVPGTAWVHAPITMGYDRYPERLIDEKEALLAELVTRGGRLFFTHDAKVALARIERDERGRYRAVV